jgi:hypothetical protein
VHVPVAEALAWREVEVAHNFVDSDPAFDSAAFSSLLVEVLAVVFALALLYILAAPEGPADASISVPDFSAGIATTRFAC